MTAAILIALVWFVAGIAVASLFGMASLIGRHPGEEDSHAPW